MRRQRPETLGEKCHRYRGVIFVVAVPLVLISIVLALMPRSSGPILDGWYSPQSQGGGTGGGGGGVKIPAVGEGGGVSSTTDRYAVVFDAGSTGSRVHVFRFNEQLDLLEINGKLEIFKMLKPGLSSFKANPKDGGESLRPLFEAAKAAVPEALQSSTPLVIGATAGLRLLPGDLANDLLHEVRTVAHEYNFKFVDEACKIIEGTDEGAYAWVSVNSLLGKLGMDFDATAGVVDLGGGSVQMAYAVSPAVAALAPPQGSYIRNLDLKGVTYNLYVHSYLRYGLMAARAEILGLVNSGSHPCVAGGYKGEYSYAGAVYAAEAPESGSDALECGRLATLALKKSAPCDADKCTFNGVWAGEHEGPKILYVASYFFDRASQLGIIQDADAMQMVVKLNEFTSAARTVCATSETDMKVRFPKAEENDWPYLCLDISFCVALLRDGFGLAGDKEVTLVKTIEYKGKTAEVAWPLGAAIEAMGKMR